MALTKLKKGSYYRCPECREIVYIMLMDTAPKDLFATTHIYKAETGEVTKIYEKDKCRKCGRTSFGICAPSHWINRK